MLVSRYKEIQKYIREQKSKAIIIAKELYKTIRKLEKAIYSNKSYYYNLERYARLRIDIHPPPEDFGLLGSSIVDTNSDDDREEEGRDSPSRLEFIEQGQWLGDNHLEGGGRIQWF